MEIIFATKNQGKIREINEIMNDSGFTIISMEEKNIFIDIDETGETFEENAIIKAKEIWKISKSLVMSDDSGIEIDFFDQKPGVHSARFLGENTTYDIKNKKILEMLNGVPFEKRSARFISVIALISHNGDVITTKGIIEGYISEEVLGSGGFGYDPIFFLPEFNKTSAQLSLLEKNKISHRGKALQLMKNNLLKLREDLLL